MTQKTKSQAAADDVAALLRARNPLIWIVTREEARVEGYLFEAATAAKMQTFTWDCAQGVCRQNGAVLEGVGGPDIGATLADIRTRLTSQKGRAMWVLRDLPVWLAGPIGMQTLRAMRNLVRELPMTQLDYQNALVVLSPSGDVPPELANHATVIEWPLPDREEIAEVLDSTLEILPDDIRANAAPNGKRDAAIDAAVGLSGEEARACYSRSLVQTKRIDPKLVAQEKKRVITRDRVLEWFDPLAGGLDAVGGLDNLKVWLRSRTNAYSPRARAYGLPAPKGIFVAGVSGCGKTLIAKGTAAFFECPLVRLDLGALKGKFVGESEANIRKAFRVIEALGRCVVLVDEIEKALAGATSGSADGGVSSDALGSFLTWMQERTTEAFVIATANEIEGLPPELLRKGRFDELWFVDLPTASERAAILAATLRQYLRYDPDKSFPEVVAATKDFTGSEVAAIVPDAMYAAFSDGEREISEADLVAAAKTVVPLSKTANKKIEALREWSRTRARAATSADALDVEKTAGKRQLDIA